MSVTRWRQFSKNTKAVRANVENTSVQQTNRRNELEETVEMHLWNKNKSTEQYFESNLEIYRSKWIVVYLSIT